MINFANAGDALKRLTNVVPATSDYTCVFWWRYTNTSGDRVPWITFDDPGTYVDWIQFFSSGDFLTLSIGLASVDHSSISLATQPDVLYPISYVRSGNEHKFYFNGDLVDTITLDISTATLGETWLGDDSFMNEADQDFYNFREWSAALNETELLNEFTHSAAQRTANLVTDTPLLVDDNDDSGNGNDWTPVGANSFVGTPPLNSSFYTATPIALPGSVVQNANDSDDDHTWPLYFRVDVLTGMDGILPWGFGGSITPGTYKPETFFYDNLTRTLFPANQSPEANKPGQFPATPGQSYFLVCVPDGDHASATLTLSVLPHFAQPVPVGSLFINDDTEGLPAVIISALTDYSVLKIIQDMPAGEAGDIASDGQFCLEDILTETFKFFNTEYQLIIEISDLDGNDGFVIRTCQGTDSIYVGERAHPGAGSPIVRSYNSNGVQQSEHEITSAANLNSICTNNDGTTLFYAEQGVNKAIEAWDLSTDTALPNFVAAEANVTVGDMLFMPDNTLIAHRFNVGSSIFIARRYNAVGTLINSYDFSSIVGSAAFTPRLAYDLTPDFFWIYIPESELGNGFSKFVKVRISDMTPVLVRLSIGYTTCASDQDETTTPTAREGQSTSCPFFLIRSSPFPPAAALSGIYKLVPNKRNDTVWTDVNAQTTENIKIPDPFIRTAMFGS